MAINASANVEISIRYPKVYMWLYSWLLVFAVRCRLLSTRMAITKMQRYLMDHICYRISNGKWKRLSSG